MTDKEFQSLLNRGAKIAAKAYEVHQELTKAFEDRYGTTYSDVDADEIIDILDYQGGKITVKEVDEIMANTGNPKL